MNKLLHLVGDVRFGLVGAEHHFFASCHGKGPCDGRGGWTKTYLRQQEMREGIHLDTSMDLLTLLVRDKAYGNNAGPFHSVGAGQGVRQQRGVGGGDRRAAEVPVAHVHVYGLGGGG
jgi:hypothetical protein